MKRTKSGTIRLLTSLGLLTHVGSAMAEQPAAVEKPKSYGVAIWFDRDTTMKFDTATSVENCQEKGRKAAFAAWQLTTTICDVDDRIVLRQDYDPATNKIAISQILDKPPKQVTVREIMMDNR